MRRRSGIDKILSAAIPAIPSHPSHPIPTNPTMLDGTLADNNVDAVDAVDAGLGKVVRASSSRNSVSSRALERAIKIVGKVALARKLGVAYQSVDKWIVRGMPKSEWDGRTTYCKIIEEATGGEITRDMLMGLPVSD
mgnify:CR=1 FL=1|tara:strand:- start:2292 stop:2702 length:411 start_codon:yes stop_codon:yes gene_type:complete